MLTLLKTVVAPQVEHGWIIWISTSQYSVNLIESIQRKLTKVIDCFQTYDGNLQMPITTTSYHEQLKMLSIYSLKRRRERFNIIYIYNIILQLLPNPGLEIHNNPSTKVKVTPKQISSAPSAWVRSLRNGSFFIIGPQLHNSNPDTLEKLENHDKGEKKVENFQKKLDEYLGKIPDAPGSSQNSFLQ